MNRAIWAWTLAVGVLSTSGLNAAVEFKAQVLDGAKSTETLREKQGLGDWESPLADQTLEVSTGDKSWPVKTDASGFFSLDTGLANLKEGDLFVVSGTVGGTKLYSRSFRPSTEVAKLFLYETTDDPSRVTASLHVVHRIVPGGEAAQLRTHVHLMLNNFDPALYVGTKRAGGSWRQVLRLRIPSNAKVVRNSGPTPGLEWKPSKDHRWMIIDEPVPGVADLFLNRESFLSWDLVYTVPAEQEMGQSFDFDLDTTVAVYCEKDKIQLEHSKKLVSFNPIAQIPFSGETGSFDVYSSPSNPGSGSRQQSFSRGEKLALGMQISNVAIGQISRRALKWHGGFVILSLVAILLGMLLSPRRPPDETALAGLSRDEILDRIAQLDERHTAGKIRESEYRAYRDAMVAIVAEDLDAESVTPASSTPKDSTVETGRDDRVSYSPEVEKLTTRIREVDSTGDASPELIAERAHLLEALFKKLDSEIARREETLPGE